MSSTDFDDVTQYFISFLGVFFLNLFLRSFVLLNLVGITKKRNENMINNFCC